MTTFENDTDKLRWELNNASGASKVPGEFVYATNPSLPILKTLYIALRGAIGKFNADGTPITEAYTMFIDAILNACLAQGNDPRVEITSDTMTADDLTELMPPIRG